MHDRAIVQVQGSIALSADSEPQPDLAVLRWRDDFYRDALPTPLDVILLVEVVDTSTETDRSKITLYAAARVPQVWLVGLPSEAVEDHRDPGPSAYTTITARRPGDQLAVEELPDIVVDSAAVLA